MYHITPSTVDGIWTACIKLLLLRRIERERESQLTPICQGRRRHQKSSNSAHRSQWWPCTWKPRRRSHWLPCLLASPPKKWTEEDPKPSLFWSMLHAKKGITGGHLYTNTRSMLHAVSIFPDLTHYTPWCPTDTTEGTSRRKKGKLPIELAPSSNLVEMESGIGRW